MLKLVVDTTPLSGDMVTLTFPPDGLGGSVAAGIVGA
jgi:hypothetical protein